MPHRPQLELGLEIIKLEKPLNPELEKWKVAIHEAGHAVVAIYYDVPFISIKIDSHLRGWTYFDEELIESNLKTDDGTKFANKMVIVGYGGYCLFNFFYFLVVLFGVVCVIHKYPFEMKGRSYFQTIASFHLLFLKNSSSP